MKNKGNLLIADEGKVLTDGENYASVFDLGTGKDETDYNEITEEEYNEILQKERLEESEE